MAIKKLWLIFVFAFSVHSFAANKLNRVYGYFSGSPLPPIMQTGLAYDRLLDEKWALGLNYNYEGLSFFQYAYWGHGTELIGRFFLWGYGKSWFEKGFIASLGTGFNYVYYSFNEEGLGVKNRKSKYQWQFPLTLSASYIYTFDMGLFFEAGVKAQLTRLQVPLDDRATRFFINPMPKIYVSLGMAF
ncbi:MAG TPA: hypothetical protein VEL47_00020 [Myxococcota bacterium]|nr:hypothetical protein [Myxococcota bacterium]